MNKMDLTSWENRTETRTGGLSAQMAAMAGATFGMDPPQDVMPPLWHWFAFPPDTATEDLGRDGHPPLGGFLPAVPLQRRMWAGGTLTFHKPLHVDEPLSRVSTIRKIEEKQGRAGPMVFVTVHHAVSGRDGLAIEEEHNIVYLEIPDRYSPPPKQAAPEATVIDEAVTTSAILLFRYSALTFNSHRIHYDLDYTRNQEHYPGLVVHGPLQATLLIGAATRHMGRCPDRFSYRGVHPAFAGEPLRVLATPQEDGALQLCTAVEADGARYQTMQAKAIWED